MKLFRYFILLLFLGLALFSACGDKSDEHPDVSGIEVNLEVRRLEQEIFRLGSKQEVADFLAANPILTEHYFNPSGRYSRADLVNILYDFIRYPPNDTLQRDVSQIFDGFGTIEEDLRNLFRHIKHYWPEYETPEVYTMVSGFGVSGFGQDLVVGPGIVVIGLDYYAGDGAVYTQPGTPRYIQRRYQPEYIVPHLATFLSSVFNSYEAADQSMLGEMIFYGKSYSFANKVLPHVHDSLIIGYTAQELADSHGNQEVIWAHFVENELFYEKSHFTKNKYVGEAPFVNNISRECPGRIGRWLGWEIVRAYMRKHPETSFQQLMQTASAQHLFQESGYRPRPGKK